MMSRAAGQNVETRDFVLDPFQVAATEAIDSGMSVLVAAPTGAGKTVVAEHAVAKAIREGRRVFYTTPIKALSNQKFNDFLSLYGTGAVGLLTGDNTINGDAPIVVMTTEVLRNMIYVDSSALADLAYVILDEVHYLQDAYRGPVWEEVIIHLPPHAKLVCLSATVSNADELAGWIEAVRGPTALITEDRRPVELDNFYLTHDRKTDRLSMVPVLDEGRPNPQGRRFDLDPHQRWGKRRFATPRRAEVVEHLLDAQMLPAIYFIFSRAACEDSVKACLSAGIRLTDDGELIAIRAIVERHIDTLDSDDLVALGYGSWMAGLEAGLASHHAGLVPPFKEAVEECFVAGLVKVVFATETLALGINMPARTVVIEKLTKFTGERHEFLTPGQYTQLTGRAGRRGIDNHGNAIVAWSPFIPFDRVAGLVTSRQFQLESAFRPTYNMAVNLVRRHERAEARKILRRSFAQYQTDRRSRRKSGRSGPGQRTLVDTFEAVNTLLGEWGYVDGWTLTDNGVSLTGIYHECDLLLAESMNRGLLDGLEPESMAAMASCFTYESRVAGPPSEPWFPNGDLKKRYERIRVLAEQLNSRERRLGLNQTRQPDPGFVALAHAWASGLHLDEVLDDESIPGGDFVRNIRQLLDLLRQIADVSASPTTTSTALSAVDAMMRGVVAASSAVGAPRESGREDHGRQ